MADRSTARPGRPTQDPGDPLAEIEGMILRLTELRRQERSRARQADYAAAIDRLHALAFRLADAGPSRTVGRATMPARVPARQAAPVPEQSPAPPQRTLPLGPVIVVARKPRPR